MKARREKERGRGGGRERGKKAGRDSAGEGGGGGPGGRGTCWMWVYIYVCERICECIYIYIYMDFGYIRISLDARETGTVDASKISGEGTAWAWLKEHQGQVMCLPPHQGLRGSHWLACTQQALDAREPGLWMLARSLVNQHQKNTLVKW